MVKDLGNSLSEFQKGIPVLQGREDVNGDYYPDAASRWPVDEHSLAANCSPG